VLRAYNVYFALKFKVQEAINLWLSSLDIQLLDTYPKFPINTLALTASKFKLSIEFRERQKVHFHMHHYSLTTSVMSSTGQSSDFLQLSLIAVIIKYVL